LPDVEILDGIGHSMSPTSNMYVWT